MPDLDECLEDASTPSVNSPAGSLNQSTSPFQQAFVAKGSQSIVRPAERSLACGGRRSPASIRSMLVQTSHGTSTVVAGRISPSTSATEPQRRKASGLQTVNTNNSHHQQQHSKPPPPPPQEQQQQAASERHMTVGDTQQSGGSDIGAATSEMSDGMMTVCPTSTSSTDYDDIIDWWNALQ